jgi:hypothetical protein
MLIALKIWAAMKISTTSSEIDAALICPTMPNDTVQQQGPLEIR